MEKTFLYFAYGSNMLKKRLLINNKSAVKKCIGYLMVIVIYLNFIFLCNLLMFILIL